MADQKKAGMISGMSPLPVLTGDELMEVSSRQTDGTWKTFSIIVNKIRTNQGLSAYEVALVNGFQGTAEEWLESLNGESAYNVAVSLGYVGTEAEWLESLVGPSTYALAVEQGFDGTLSEYLESLKGQSAYQVAVLGGYVGTEAEWLLSLVGKSAYQLALEIDPTVGSEAEWLLTLVGKSAYQVALDAGFVGTESAWLLSLQGKSAYEIWLAIPGNEDGTEVDFIDSLKGADGVDGTDGINGQSAYELWLALPANVGKTEAEFLDSLKGADGTNGTDGVDGTDGTNGVDGTDGANGVNGESAYEVWLAIPGNEDLSVDDFFESLRGADGTNGTNGTDGESTYQLWEAQPENIGKTEAEFLASIKGDVGDSAYQVAVDAGYVGTEAEWLESLDGATGQSAYELWVEQPANVSKTEAEFLTSLVGLSAYQTWLAVPANVGKTEVEFLASLKGEAGEQGESAYQVWVDAGNVGTEVQFLNSLKGADGTNGTNGTNGSDGEDINVLGTVTQEDFDLIVAAGDAVKGDAYFVETFLYVFNGTDWVKSNSLAGPEGTGLNYLGTWPNAQQLPLGPTYSPGDTYMWQGNMWTLMAEPTRAWVATGVPGPQGKSAYQVWVEQVGNTGKTEIEYIASLKGETGEIGPEGPDGLSAYQVWVAIPANVGKTEAEFFQALTGPSGTNGANAVAFTIAGQLAEESELPIPGEPTEAYYVGQSLFVWIDALNAYENLGSLNGASAYQIWLSQPDNSGTEQDFLDSLKGLSAYEIAFALNPNIGTEAVWIESLQGTDGDNLQVNGVQPDEATILAIVDPGDQEAWVAEDTGNLFIYNGTEWIDAGPFRGPAGADGTNGVDGTDGTNGVDGESTYALWEAQPGNTGKTEAEFLASLKGTNGTNGANGRNVEIKGSVATFADLAELVAPVPQDAYTTLDTGVLYMYIAGTWTNLGQFRGNDGIQGVQGVPGQGITIIAEVDTLVERPDVATLQPGDAVYVLEDHKLYQVNDAGVYGPGIQIQGPQGLEGPIGPQGASGTSIAIMGSFATEAALIAAVPVGTAGEGYLIGDDLWLYGVNPATSTTEWYNVGPVRGPQGLQGDRGPQGLRGLIGPIGPRGALWLFLPPGQSEPLETNGQVGDWAVNDNFDSFYKDAVQGWILIGRLVAGDVNSPLPSEGKVVREGTSWVPLPVDAVPNAVLDVQYVMKGDADGGTTWAVLTVPEAGIPDVPAATVIPQGRTTAGWVPVMAAPTGNTAGRRYELLNGAWVTSAIQAAAPVTQSVALCYQVDATGAGSWVLPTFDRYSLRQDASARTGNITPDFATQQTFRVNAGAGSSPNVITLNAGTTARTMMAVFVVEGDVNKLTFVPGTGAPTLGYNNGVAAVDIEYGATQTVITAFWNGFGTWIIAKGPSF